jgi:hypothetical protein
MRIIEEHKGIFEVTKGFYETFKESCSTDESRIFTNYVYFDQENKVFIATDGRRMIYHYDTAVNSESGFYELAKIGKKYKLIPIKDQGTFPNWKRVVPVDSELEYVYMKSDQYGDNQQHSIFSVSGNLVRDSWFLCNMIRNIDCNINIEFITKVLKHVNQFEIMKNREKSGDRAIVFIIDKNTRYIVMPMNKN